MLDGMFDSCVTLHNGVRMPQLGFGMARVGTQEATALASAAIDSGYRLLDTATAYGNERELGLAIASAEVPRHELFITTKLPRRAYTYDLTLKAFDASLARLELDCVDLYLVHWPLPMLDSYVQVWRALERVYHDGRSRAIGVSNFTEEHLWRLQHEADVPPAVNQVELHPGFPQESLRRFHRDHDIVTEAWSPLGMGRDLLESPVVQRIARSHGRQPAQVVLRWHLQLGNVAIPKAASPDHIRANLQVFDFELAPEEMQALDFLTSPGRLGPDPEAFGYDWHDD